MPDITLANIVDAIETRDPVLSAYIDTMPALPADVDVNEFLLRFIDGARYAQATYNVGKPVGERLNSYAVTTANSTINANGDRTSLTTGTVTSLVAVDLLVAVPAMV
jgi:hypothetical protein